MLSTARKNSTAVRSKSSMRACAAITTFFMATKSAFGFCSSGLVYEDALIAATAAVHNLTIVTRNVADFRPFSVRVLNPFKIAKP